jgi:hypothetical protein
VIAQVRCGIAKFEVRLFTKKKNKNNEYRMVFVVLHDANVAVLSSVIASKL